MSTSGTKSFRVSDGDWICPDKKCGNVNFARRTSCNRCGREKTTEAKMMKAGGTEIGKTLAEKSRGLFSANDWQCKTCGNVNWARRSECNMCNTPKYAKLEERTGYGGGFNERENVEYIEREESDGEYDEELLQFPVWIWLQVRFQVNEVTCTLSPPPERVSSSRSRKGSSPGKGSPHSRSSTPKQHGRSPEASRKRSRSRSSSAGGKRRRSRAQSSERRRGHSSGSSHSGSSSKKKAV
ncbi:hypothetical protein CRUP_027280 [Coryphaenoides rupestris]|nr:hypothetical protein CRUP_027280 [Coryphaenoides rupestris]